MEKSTNNLAGPYDTTYAGVKFNIGWITLGKYSIGSHYKGKFGKAYKLYGLDKTNSNAFNRSIVLHKYSAVPYEEQDATICHSFGCPMVNVKYFERIEKIIDNSKTNIILSIYY